MGLFKHRLFFSFLNLVYYLFINWPHRVEPAYLRLSEAKLSSQLGSLGQGEVLRLLEAPLKRSELVAGVDGPWLANLFWLSIHHADLRLWFLFHWNKQIQIGYLEKSYKRSYKL